MRLGFENTLDDDVAFGPGAFDVTFDQFDLRQDIAGEISVKDLIVADVVAVEDCCALSHCVVRREYSR